MTWPVCLPLATCLLILALLGYRATHRKEEP